MQDSSMSQAISFSLWLRWCPNSGSGQWRSLMKDWRADSFQNRSSLVAQPELGSNRVRNLKRRVSQTILALEDAKNAPKVMSTLLNTI